MSRQLRLIPDNAANDEQPPSLKSPAPRSPTNPYSRGRYGPRDDDDELAEAAWKPPAGSISIRIARTARDEAPQRRKAKKPHRRHTTRIIRRNATRIEKLAAAIVATLTASYRSQGRREYKDKTRHAAITRDSRGRAMISIARPRQYAVYTSEETPE